MVRFQNGGKSVASRPAFNIHALQNRLLSLLLLEERQSVGGALVRTARGDVVRVAADDHEPRIPNLYLVSPRFFVRIHLAAVGRNHQGTDGNALQDALL